MRLRFYLNVLTAALVSYAGSSAASEAPQTDQYETPGPVNAQDFLPKSALSGKKIFVEKVAQNDGLQNTYRIRAGVEKYEITGSTAAMEVLQELRAIHQLRQISTAKAFTRGLKESAKGTYQSGKEIVRDPAGALKKVPEGASKFFGKVKGFFSDDEEDAGQGASAGETVKGILGVDKAKRKLAARLGVDVYSRNQVLQDELDRVASAAAGGGVAFDIGTLPIGGAVGIGLTVIGVQQAVDSLINDSSPISLRNWNEENLIKLGANRDLVFQFIDHPWYTLRQITVITTSLVATKVNPDLFLESANKALTPADGRYFEQVAELLAVYSQKTAPLQSLRLQDGLLCAIDTNGVLIVPVSLDYAIWTAKVAQRVDDLAHLPVDDPTIKGVQVCTDGKASERVKSELSKRKIGYQSLWSNGVTVGMSSCSSVFAGEPRPSSNPGRAGAHPYRSGYFSFCGGCPSCVSGMLGNCTLTDFTSRRRASWPCRQVLMASANSVIEYWSAWKPMEFSDTRKSMLNPPSRCACQAF